MRLLWKTTCAGLWVGSGIAAAWITASWPRTTAKAAPASVRSACTYAASLGSGRSNTGAPRSVAVTSWPAASRASTVARPTLPRAPVTRMRMARNLPAARAASGPQPVAGGSCRRITLLRLRRLRLRTCPPPPARAASLPRGRPRPCRGPRASTPSRPQLLRGRCAAALRQSIAPPWSGSALASQQCASGPSPSARRPSGWRLMGDLDGCCSYAGGRARRRLARWSTGICTRSK